MYKFVYVQMCVSIWACMYIYLYAYIQRRKDILGVIPQEPSNTYFFFVFIYLFIYFGCQVSLWPRVPSNLHWGPSKFQKPTCLYIPGADITNTLKNI